VTSFALPAHALPGDRLPDTWLRIGGGERVRLHKAFGGRPIWLAVGVEAGSLPPPPDGVDALHVGPEEPAASPRWASVTVDPAWGALFQPGVLRLDGNFRVIGALAETDMRDGAQTPSCAPVLQIPSVLEPELCRALVEHFERECGGGDASHVLVIENGLQVPQLLPEIKARRESPIRSPDLEAAVHARLHRRVVAEIARVFQFDVARRDPFKLLSYAEGAGYFRPHRDNDTSDVAYRRFAISVNLDADAYAGGAFRFPEFGPHQYSPPTGGALVFSCSLLHEVLPIERGIRHALTTFVA
jgi:predicted 2-oxoglutarate/Fe(II)-dependent dioxygenase YbiX